MILSAYLKPMINWLHANPGWAETFTFLFAFSESIAIIGLFVPGSVILTAIGALIGSGVIPMGMTVFLAVLGAILGDTFSYWLGYHYSHNIRAIWPFNKFPDLLKKGEQFFARHGGKSVFIGRFCGPIRPITPIVAGMLKMNPGRFLIATSLSGLGWAPAYMLPGIFLGAASLMFTSSGITHFATALLIFIIVVWVTLWLIRRFFYKLYLRFDRLLAYFWYRMQRRPSLQLLAHLFLVRESDSYTEYSGQLHLALLFLLIAGLFIFTSINVSHHGFITTLNEPLYHFFRSIRTSWLDSVSILFTNFGDKKIILPFVVLVSGWLLFKRYFREGIHWLANTFIAAGTGFVIKTFVASPRPLGNAVIRDSYSYPSGHTLLATSVFCFFAVLAGDQRPDKRKVYYCLAAIAILLVALSRLELNAHWLTDILGAILLGLSSVMLVTLSYRRYITRPINLKQLSYVFFGLLFGLWIVFNFMKFDSQIKKYHPVWPVIESTMNQWWQQKPAKINFYTNRFGQPKGYFNIEWLGNLTIIQKALQEKGWKTMRDSRLQILIQHLSDKHYDQIIPFMSPLYQDKPHTFELIYFKEKMPPLVLQFWSSSIVINDQTLWYGHVFYYHSLFLPSPLKLVDKQDQRAIKQLQGDLRGFQFKINNTKDEKPILFIR